MSPDPRMSRANMQMSVIPVVSASTVVSGAAPAAGSSCILSSPSEKPIPQKTPATTTTPVASPITRADLGWPGYSTKTRANARTPSTVPCTMARINSVCRTRLRCLVIKSRSLASARVSITPGWFPALPPAPTIMVTNSAITMCLWNMSSNLPMMSAEKDCSSSRNMSHGVRIRICLHRGTFRYSSISRALVWLSVVTVDPESSSSVQMPASQSSLWACFSRNRRSRFSPGPARLQPGGRRILDRGAFLDQPATLGRLAFWVCHVIGPGPAERGQRWPEPYAARSQVPTRFFA
eukprot:scaffold66559_cov63-Phaeocystis_antarctica.AAC.3